MTEHAQPDPRRPLAKRPGFWLGIVATLLLIGVAITAISWAIGPTTDASPSAPASDPAAPGPPTDGSAPATASPAPPAAGVVIPTDCADIYTRDWSAEFAPLVSNPSWTTAPGSGVHYGSSDETAIARLDTTKQVTCKWANPLGGSDRGLTTNVAAVDAEQSVAMQDHFVATGHTCYAELEGTRCVTETPPSPDGQAGESHFFRDGVWIATKWVNAGPDGYTHDIVAAIFG